MTPKEFQAQHDLTDEEMAKIREICILFKGRVVKILNGAWKDVK